MPGHCSPHSPDPHCDVATGTFAQYPLCRGRSMWVFFAALIIGGFIAAPALLIWGWVRWTRQPQQRSIFPILSLAGFAFATASSLLAVSSVMYSVGICGFPYYDPRLLRIFRLGILLSLVGIALGIGGLWSPSSLRWHAPASAFRTLMFWIMA